jgi:uncharacterized protein YoxC
MSDILLGIGVGTLIFFTAFHIAYVVNVKRASDRMTAFFQNTEANINGALSELQGTLKNMKKITGNVSEVTEEVRRIAETAAKVERSMEGLYGSLRQSVGAAAGARIAGVKAGIRTGVVTLVKNLQEGRSDDHGRRARKEGR